MSFSIDVQALRARAAKRVSEPATHATAATLLPDDPPEVAGLATVATFAGSQRAWGDAEIGRFIARRDRLLRWGWAESEAEATAERLTRRDIEGNDDRVSCADCMHHKPGRCANHRAAHLAGPEVGRQLASMLQRCPGHAALEGPT